MRRKDDQLARYVHLSTGNYNPATARVYTDLALHTSNPAIASDVALLFNFLTGYAEQIPYRALLVAPDGVRRGIIERIERVTAQHRRNGQGYTALKLNGLTDPACIQALYRASQAGVPIDLQIRGICCLRPGVPGISERITVTSLSAASSNTAASSISDQATKKILWSGSADLMPHNLDGRIEVVFPVEASHLRRMNETGLYDRVTPQPSEPRLPTTHA